MRTIYIRNLVKGYLKKKWIIIVGLIVFILLFGFIGIRRAYPEKMDSSLSDEVEAYNDAIETYDEQIAGIQDNLEVAKAELAEQQEYCDNCLIMKIDAENVQTASVQYTIVIEGNGSESDKNIVLTNVLNSLKSYFQDGSMSASLLEQLDYESIEYLSEIISCSTGGQNFSMTVKHFDMEQANAILDVMMELVDEYKTVLEQTLDVTISMNTLERIEMAGPDKSILSSQYTYMNNLKTYETSVTDLQNKLLTQQTAKNNYIRQYAPVGTSSSPRVTLLEYLAVGVLAGILIPLMIYAIYYTLSGRIKGKEELLAANLNVLMTYRPKKGYAPDLKMAVKNLVLLVRKNQAERISLYVMGESHLMEQVEQDLVEALDNQNLQTCVTHMDTEDAEQLENLAKIGNNVLLVETGRTTYTQLEEQIQFCESLDITIWGCVVIE